MLGCFHIANNQINGVQVKDRADHMDEGSDPYY